MKDKRHFWLPATTWNINDILIDESISPLSFYKIRKYGSPNHEPADNNGAPLHLENAIILYPNSFMFRPSLGAPVFFLIHPGVFDQRFLVEDDNGLAYYYKTIYLRRGNFQLRFQSEIDMKMFEAGAKMNLELKVIPKYRGEYPFSDKPQPIITVNALKEVSVVKTNNIFDKPHNLDQIYFDKAINHIKGFIYGFLSVTVGGDSIEIDRFVASLEKLKSRINGLRTKFIMSTEYNEEDVTPIIEEIRQIKELYSSLEDEPIFDLSNIEDRIDQLKILQSDRIKEIERKRLSLIDKKQIPFDSLQNEIETIDYKDSILKKEKESLLYKKKILEEKLKAAKKHRQDFISIEFIKDDFERIKDEIKEVENKRKGLRTNKNIAKSNLMQSTNVVTTSLDETINDQFYAITSKIDSWMLYKNWTPKQGGYSYLPDLKGLEIDSTSLSNLYKLMSENNKNDFPLLITLPKKFEEGLDSTEKTLLDVIINTVLTFNHDQLSDVSDYRLRQILKTVIQEFLKRGAKDNKTLTQIAYLKHYQDYKDGKLDTFDLPQEWSVVSNFIAFLTKANSNTELKKFLIERNVNNHFLAFVIWGTFIGFSSMPKTFTDQLFEKGGTAITDIIDDFLFNNFINA